MIKYSEYTYKKEDSYRDSCLDKEKSRDANLNEKWTLEGSIKAAGYWAITSAGEFL